MQMLQSANEAASFCQLACEDLSELPKCVWVGCSSQAWQVCAHSCSQLSHEGLVPGCVQCLALKVHLGGGQVSCASSFHFCRNESPAKFNIIIFSAGKPDVDV